MPKRHSPAAGGAAEGEISHNADGSPTAKIRSLNDRFRNTLLGGTVLITPGVSAVGRERVQTVLAKVREFTEFAPDNDPHGEHDFGAFDDGGDRFFWKIDYYNPTLTAGSGDPSDPNQTHRVLTVMLASEY